MHSVLDEHGHERFADAERGAALIAEARKTLDAAEAALGDDELSRADLGRALQRLSEYLRLFGELQEAASLKRRAIAIWGELGRKRASFLVRMQLALVEWELGGPHTPFGALFDELRADPDLAPYLSTLEDYAGRHG